MGELRQPDKAIYEDVFSPQDNGILGFCILDSVDESALGPTSEKVHRHPFYEMVFIENADGEHVIDYTNYDSLNNVVFLISPGQTHYWKNVTHASGFLIYFTEDFLFQSYVSINSFWEIQLFKEIAISPAIYMNQEFANSIMSISQLMLKEYSEKKLDYPEVIRACLNIMLIQFHRFHTMAENETKGLSLHTYANELNLRMENLIDQKITENLSVSEYAAILGVSQGFLNEQVRKKHGVSAGKLIKHARLNEIKRLLLNTDLNVNEISDIMCFEDVAYFCRAFKKETGLSPSKFRQEFYEKKQSRC